MGAAPKIATDESEALHQMLDMLRTFEKEHQRRPSFFGCGCSECKDYRLVREILLKRVS